MALEPTKHVNGRMWPPGVSGNPNGRPVGSRTVFSQAFLKDLAEVWSEEGQEVAWFWCCLCVDFLRTTHHWSETSRRSNGRRGSPGTAPKSTVGSRMRQAVSRLQGLPFERRAACRCHPLEALAWSDD